MNGQWSSVVSCLVLVFGFEFLFFDLAYGDPVSESRI
jgi:hypothetical protein